jgi:hypothetical protein
MGCQAGKHGRVILGHGLVPASQNQPTNLQICRRWEFYSLTVSGGNVRTVPAFLVLLRSVGALLWLIIAQALLRVTVLQYCPALALGLLLRLAQTLSWVTVLQYCLTFALSLLLFL